MAPFFGFPINVRPRSITSTFIIDPRAGFDNYEPATDIPLGASPSSDNFIFQEGALEPRPMLTLFVAASVAPMGNISIRGGFELVDVTNDRYPIVSGTTRWSAYGIAAAPNTWSVLSYVSSFGYSDPPTASATDFWDFTQIYDARPDENLAIGANTSRQSIYCHQSDTTLFSTLTSAPRARYVAALDNYLLAFNQQEGTIVLPQRVSWSDRGNPSNWTGGLSGFEDLLTMKGEGTRILTQDNRLVLFSDSEVWVGMPRDYPHNWRFEPYDGSVGCPYSWSIAQTPLGILFLSKEYQVYLLPKGGGHAQPVGQRVKRELRTQIKNPERSWAVFDSTLGHYQLHYPRADGHASDPSAAVWLNVHEGTWTRHSYDSVSRGFGLTRGFEFHLPQSSTTWGGLTSSGTTWGGLTATPTVTWASMEGTFENRAVMLGSSQGSLYYQSSDVTSDHGTVVRSVWRSGAYGGEDPSRKKTIMEWRADYQATSASSLSVRYSASMGADFAQGSAVDLPATSHQSQAVAYPYLSTLYPQFEVSSEGHRYRLFRFWATHRHTGR